MAPKIAEEDREAHPNEWAGMKSSALFIAAVVSLVAASGFAGAMLRPVVARWIPPSAPSAGELAIFLEHAAVDVRLGRGASLVDRLGSLAAQVGSPVTKERILGLWTEAALQAGRLQDAARAEERREALVKDPAARAAIRLRRIGLAAALGDRSRAADVAQLLIEGNDARLADEARLRLAAAMKEEDLRSWVAGAKPDNAEEARRAGMAALRLLGDASQAERLLGPLGRSGQIDASLAEALVDVYSRLDRPQDVARIAGGLLRQTTGEPDARIVMLYAEALARTGNTRGALAALDPLRRSRRIAVRQAARRARYEVLRQAGHLEREIASLRDPAERAFVALEVEHHYEEATRLYRAASSAHPDSLELADGLREAERRRDLAERRTLYERVLEKDPKDSTTRDKLFAVLVEMGDEQAARQWVQRMLEGRAADAETLIGVALTLKKAGLDREAADHLEKAYRAEGDVTKKQQILFTLGDLYAGARQEDSARRLYTSLAAEGASPEIRELAVARLASLLR